MQRKTRQRSAIRRAFEHAARPMGPTEILEAAQEELPSLGIATVYRSIKDLVEEGWLKVVDLPGTPSRYEVAGKGHHHHFHCQACDKVYEVEDCPGSLHHLTPEGFELEAHEIILYGTCSSCVGTA